MMRTHGFCCAIVLMLFSTVAHAEQAGWTLLNKVQQAVKEYNFDASFVVLKGNQVDTYRWLHGKSDQQEIEHLIPLDTNGVDILRRNGSVYYLLSDRPAFVLSGQHIAELPAVLFEPKSKLEQLYNAVPGSSSVMSGRSAQLLRLTAKLPSRYHYWLWLDDETGFPLRIDTLSEQQAPLERWLITHMQLSPEFPENLQALLDADLPEPVVAEVKPMPDVKQQLTWLPDAYQVIAQPASISQLESHLQSYWLLTDGLHQVSVFVQPSQGLPTQAYRDGATTIFVQSSAGLEVTVIGPISIDIARQLAAGIK